MSSRRGTGRESGGPRPSLFDVALSALRLGSRPTDVGSDVGPVFVNGEERLMRGLRGNVILHNDGVEPKEHRQDALGRRRVGQHAGASTGYYVVVIRPSRFAMLKPNLDPVGFGGPGDHSLGQLHGPLFLPITSLRPRAFSQGP